MNIYNLFKKNNKQTNNLNKSDNVNTRLYKCYSSATLKISVILMLFKKI